ncbi:MAG TPA: CRISPR-associated endonuclease Cas1 [Methanocorpusculum sp.]|nr:CRISPR-associated endonuclease Cas1 [Methanocorpusculum sp.]
MNKSWITVWGYGSIIKATSNSLLVTKNGKTRRYDLKDINHVLICGGHDLKTSSLKYFSENGISVSFFDAHGMPTGSIYESSANSLANLQKSIPVHKFALASIKYANEARFMYIHELSEKSESGLYYKGEFDVFSSARTEINYLITLQELGRAFSLIKNMYYEILSRVVPESLGFKKRDAPPYKDPVNVLLSHGYSVLNANVAVACAGAGLDLSRGTLYGEVIPELKRNGCVKDIAEPASVSMVDKTVIDFVKDGLDENCYEITPQKCILSNELLSRFDDMLKLSVDTSEIEENVKMYANALKNGSDPVFHFSR